MSELDYHALVERFHEFQNPTSKPKLDAMVQYCGIADGMRVLDIGCGKAWLLRRMAASYAISGVGVELRAAFIAEAREHISREPGRGALSLIQSPATEFSCEPGSFDVAMCIGASFAIGTFEQMLDWLRPCVRANGILAVGDVYAKSRTPPTATSAHFSGGAVRTLQDTFEQISQAGLDLIGVIDSSVDDWDAYDSLHWQAADKWLRANPHHPERDAFRRRVERDKVTRLGPERDTLGWAMFVCRAR